MSRSRLPVAIAPIAAITLALAACNQSPASNAAPAGVRAAAVAPPAGKQWSDVIAPISEAGIGGVRMGNPAAPIKLVEYGSLTCPHCAKLSSEMMGPLVSRYVDTGKVSFEYRSFAIHGPDIPLTVLVRCADPAAAFGLIEQLYATQPALVQKMMAGQAQAEAATKLPVNQRMIGIADAMGLTDWFAAHGLATAKAHTCLANAAAAQRVADESEAISKLGINQTPTIVINGTKLEIGQTTEMSWAIVEQRLKAAGA